MKKKDMIEMPIDEEVKEYKKWLKKNWVSGRVLTRSSDKSDVFYAIVDLNLCYKCFNISKGRKKRRVRVK